MKSWQHMEKQSIKNTSSSSMSSSWVRGACIGRGSFGTVNAAISKSDGEVFAVKSVDLATCLPTQAEALENEISVLGSLKPHPNIVRFLGDGISKEGTTSFRNLHLEYLQEGDLANHVAGGIKDETLLRRYTACLVSALRHVHSQGYVHCDVKAKNVLVSRSSVIKLADFGSAIRIVKPTTTAQIMPRGSPLWMAPEVMRGEYQGPESDVWSLGCTVIEMLTGKPAWGELGMIDLLTRIDFSSHKLPVTLSEMGRDFLDKCLKGDKNQRWSCDQLLQHPFMSQCHTESSPRCVLDWSNAGFDLEEAEEEEEVRRSERSLESETAGMARICELATTPGAIWESYGWLEVRSHSEDDKAITESESESVRAEMEYNSSSDQSYDMADDATENIVSVFASPDRPPGNRGLAVAQPYKSMMILVVLMEIMVYSTCAFVKIIPIIIVVINFIVIINNMEPETLSFNLSLFVCACDWDRTIPSFKW